MYAMAYHDPLIRLARLDELPLLKDLLYRSVRKLQSSDYTAQQIESALIYIYGIDTRLILDGTYFAAEIDGEIVGCGGWSKRKSVYGGDQAKVSDSDNLRNPATDPAAIRAMFTHPDFARRGIARAIMHEAESAARRAGFKRLELLATLTGMPVYEKSGFTPVRAENMFMPDGVVLPAVYMEKWIG